MLLERNFPDHVSPEPQASLAYWRRALLYRMPVILYQSAKCAASLSEEQGNAA
jgi:hypothetical protein